MKTKWELRRDTLALGFALAVIGMTGCTYTQLAPPSEVVYVEPEPVYYYYDGPFQDLSSWGTWIETPPFGWVWRPYGPTNWQPYYYGSWMWTQWGWTWVSYEPFGWATYHYGFWHYDAIYGWIWIPDDQWFPTRVTWMYFGDYIYWAPIPPPGYYIPDPWAIHADFIWVGVSVDHFTQTDIGRYRIKDAQRTWSTTPRAEVRREAPSLGFVEKGTRTRIRVVDATRKTVRIKGREYEQIVLPPAEQKTVDRHEKRREESLRPQAKPQPKQETRPVPQPQQKPQSTKQPQKREPQPKSKSKDAKSQEKGDKGKSGNKDTGKSKEKGKGK